MKRVQVVFLCAFVLVCCAENQFGFPSIEDQITIGRKGVEGTSRIHRQVEPDETAYPVQHAPAYAVNGANPDSGATPKKSAYAVNPVGYEAEPEQAYPVRRVSAYPVNAPNTAAETAGAYPVRKPVTHAVSTDSEAIRKKSAYAVNPVGYGAESKEAYPVRRVSAYPVKAPDTESEPEAYPVRKVSAYPVNAPNSESEPDEAYPVRKVSAYPVNAPNSESEPEEAYPVRKVSAYPVNAPNSESEPEEAYPVRKVSAYPVKGPNSESEPDEAYPVRKPVNPPKSKGDSTTTGALATPTIIQPLAISRPEHVQPDVPTVSFKKDYSIYNLDNTSPVLESHDGEICEDSLTTVQNEKVCKGQLLFYDEFDSLSPKKWSNDIRIPTKPDYEFVSYVQNKNNCYIDDSELVIKPTLLSDWSDDNIVLYGRIKLDNCMVVGDSGACDKKADKFKILPPVLSAKIRTRQSFNFKYGRVEVRAKFPSGDWVYPQIWLEPKIGEYGPQYKSGRIVLGMSRGNEVLAGQDKSEYGCRQMNAGCLYRHDDTLTVNSYLSKVNKEGWYKDYHNYTVLWTPDALEYYIDGESLGKCQTPNSETKRHGSWRRGGNLAPFDKDFHISLGVGVGGMSEFPEHTTNGNAALPKPWRNGEVKAVLKFFQDQETWKKTWNENTALRVDSIKVFAI